MSAKTIAIAGLAGALEHLALNKDQASIALPFDYAGPPVAEKSNYFDPSARITNVPMNEEMKSITLGSIDTSEEASLCILQREGVYYVSLCDETLVWDLEYPMKATFHVWLLSRTSADKIVFDPYGDMSSETRTYELTYAASLLSAIMKTEADTTVRLNSALGGITAMLALVTKSLQVGTLGNLTLSPIAHLMANAYSAAYRPFLVSLYESAQAKGLLMAEECDRLVGGSDLVCLTREMLIDRGVVAAA